jgi:hypothetical protein
MRLYIGTRAADLIDINSLRERQDINEVILVNEQEHNYVSFFSADGSFNFDVLLDWANEKHINITIVNCWKSTEALLHDITSTKFNCIKNVVPWETAFFNVSLQNNGFDEPGDLDRFAYELNSEADIKYTLISLNNRPHPHRCLMMDLLQKHNLIDDQAISWIIPTRKYTDYAYEFLYWKEKQLVLDEKFLTAPNPFRTLPSEYNNSFIQLVNESTIDHYFITEKTTIPLFLKKPFIVINKINYNLWLKELGFELYEEIFDYSFDSIEDDVRRFEMAVLEIHRLNLLSRKDQFLLYNKVKDKLLANKEHAIKLGTTYPDIIKPILINNILKYDAIEIE